MLLNKILQGDYTVSSLYHQIKLPLDIEISIPSDDPVRLVSAFVEEMDLSDLYKTYDRIRKNQASLHQMLKIVIYAAMNKIYSSRDIESFCKRDINFMYLLDGAPAPDHSTIAKFISIHLSQCAKRLMAQVGTILLELGEISGENIFIDGTKIESVANKYTFVWKRAVSKNMIKLTEKVRSRSPAVNIRELHKFAIFFFIAILYYKRVCIYVGWGRGDIIMVIHPIEPIYDKNSIILILGSFPSVKSREEGFFYGHKQNRFWKVVSGVFEEEEPGTIEEKKALLIRNRIAVWDVIQSCDIEGSTDSSITNVVPNDLSVILNTADIKAIYVNGKTALKYYDKYTEPVIKRPAICLPSTSPANAAWSMEKLLSAWKIIKKY